MKRVTNTLKGLEDIRDDLLYKRGEDDNMTVLKSIFIINLVQDIRNIEQKICEAYNLTK